MFVYVLRLSCDTHTPTSLSYLISEEMMLMLYAVCNGRATRAIITSCAICARTSVKENHCLNDCDKFKVRIEMIPN